MATIPTGNKRAALPDGEQQALDRAELSARRLVADDDEAVVPAAQSSCRPLR